MIKFYTVIRHSNIHLEKEGLKERPVQLVESQPTTARLVAIIGALTPVYLVLFVPAQPATGCRLELVLPYSQRVDYLRWSLDTMSMRLSCSKVCFSRVLLELFNLTFAVDFLHRPWNRLSMSRRRSTQSPDHMLKITQSL